MTIDNTRAKAESLRRDVAREKRELDAVHKQRQRDLDRSYRLIDSINAKAREAYHLETYLKEQDNLTTGEA